MKHPTRPLAGLAAPLLASALLAACGTAAPQNPDGDAEPPPPVPSCDIDADGAISADELPITTGISVRYVRNEVGTDVTFDLDGGSDGEGGTTWDFSSGPAEVGATFVTLDPSEAWFADRFDGADFAAPMSVELPELLGVYRWVPDAGGGGELQLLGVTTATEQPAASATFIRYDEPVTALRLPMAVGDTWGQQATFRDAVTAGIPNAGVEDYLFEVDAAGSARLEGGLEVSEVLRLRSSVHRTLAVSLGDPDSQLHQAAWYAPCFGEIARVSGSDAALDPASELRRYYP